MTDNKYAQTATMVREGYEAKAGLEALARAGKNMQLKGHVHEIMFKDMYNANPFNFIQGKTAALTKSPTAPMRDIVMKQGGKVIGHAQLKDTVSSAGVRKTIEQIKAGHYNKTAVYGTKETVEKIGNRVTQPVKSTGISSETTKRIADKALGNAATLSTISSAIKSGGATGAIFGAGFEAVSSAVDVFNGKKDIGDAVEDVAVAGIKGGITGATGAAASTVVAGAAGSAITEVTATTAGGALAATTAGAVVVAAAPVAIGFAAACAVCSFISDWFD